jgi:hypothetical protein
VDRRAQPSEQPSALVFGSLGEIGDELVADGRGGGLVLIVR